MASRAALRQYHELALIGEAKVAIARGRLAEAEHIRGRCDKAAFEAEQKSDEAFESWTASIGSAMLGPRAVQAAGAQLIAAESVLFEARKKVEVASREAHEAARSFQAAEARSKAEREQSRKQARRFRARAEERSQAEVAELILGLRKENP